MIETSTVIILAAFAAWFMWNQATEKHQAQVGSIISGLRLYRDLLEQRGQAYEAERATQLADQLSSASGIVFHKLKISKDRAAEIERAVLTATTADWLTPIGINEYSIEVNRARSSLYWLAKQVARRA